MSAIRVVKQVTSHWSFTNEASCVPAVIALIFAQTAIVCRVSPVTTVIAVAFATSGFIIAFGGRMIAHVADAAHASPEVLSLLIPVRAYRGFAVLGITYVSP